MGWACSYPKQGKDEVKVNRLSSGIDIEYPDVGNLAYIIDDLNNIGLWSGDSSLNDQALFYYMQVNKVYLEPYECEIIKQCSRTYVFSYKRNDNTINPAPYAEERTDSEVSIKDDYLLAMRNKRLNK